MINAEKYKWIFDGIKNIDSIRPHGFVAKRNMGALQSFKLEIVHTEYFRTRFIKKLEQTKNELVNREIKIKEFPQEDTVKKTVYIIDVKKYKSIEKTIEDIFDTDSATPISSVNIKRIKYSAMLFIIPNNKSIITLDFISVYNPKASNVGLVTSYDESGLHEITEGDIITFKLGLPCLYFEEVHKLVVFDLKTTEEIFNLSEYYRENARTQFSKLVEDDIIDINEEVLEAWIKKNVNASKINRMIEQNAFNMTIKEYKKYIEFFSTHRDINDEVSQLNIKNNKVIIHSEDDFTAFLYWTDYAIQQSIIDPNKIYVIHSKREIGKHDTK